MQKPSEKHKLVHRHWLVHIIHQIVYLIRYIVNKK